MTETTIRTAPRVLVAYASKHGSTAEIAEAIAEELCALGVAAEAAEAGTVDSVADFDGVVVGSAVYMKRWQRSARRFLRHALRDAGDRPVWMFSSGPVGEAEPDPKWCEPAGTLARAQRLNLRDHVVFGGQVPRDPHNFIERAMLRDTPADAQDRRDFAQIRRWARDIAREVSAVGSVR